MDEKDINHLIHVFLKFSEHGLLDRNQFCQLFRDEFHYDCQREAANSPKILKKLNKIFPHPDSVLSLEQFLEIFSKTHNKLLRIFSSIDRDRSGHISVHELHQYLGPQLSEAQMRDMIKLLDKDRSGALDFAEFRELFKFIPFIESEKTVVNHWKNVTFQNLDFGSSIAPTVPTDIDRHVVRFVVAGGTAGIVSRTFTAPLERIKLQAQAFGINSVSNELKTIYQREGVRGLFAGNLANCLKVFPFSALICLVYANLVNFSKNQFPMFNSESSSFFGEVGARAVMGGIAGATAVILTYPLDVIKARMTLKQKSSPKTISGIVRHVIATEGVGAFFAGIRPTLYAVAPFIAIQQSFYDFYRSTAERLLLSEKRNSPMLFLCCGALAGVTAQTLVFPLDVLRLKLQMNLFHRGTSTYQGLKQVKASGGLFKGIVPSLYKVAPSVAVSLMVRDMIKDNW